MNRDHHATPWSIDFGRPTAAEAATEVGAEQEDQADPHAFVRGMIVGVVSGLVVLALAAAAMLWGAL